MDAASLRPVFIVGCARSGTTMLGSMLGAHPDCICTPESQFLTDFFHVADDRRRLARILADDRFLTWEPDVASVAAELETRRDDYAGMVLWLVRRYAERAGRPAAAVWIDHTGLNARFASRLLELFPAARFIHIVRDGRGVAASLLPLSWGPNTIERAARWWVEFLAHGLALESWGGPRVMRVRYEDLLEASERTARAVADFAGLDYQPAMLRADGFRLPADPARQHALIGLPPQPERGHAWMATLSSRQTEIFEWVAADMLGYLGYETRFGSRARPPSAIEHWSSVVWERAREFSVNAWRERRRRRRQKTMLVERHGRARQ